MRLRAFATLLLATLALAACSDPGDKASRTAPATAPTPTTATVPGQLLEPTTDQSQIAGVATTISQSQIDLAQLIIDRKIEGPLADFAVEQQRVHRAMTEKLSALGASKAGEHVQVQAGKGKASIESLRKIEDQKELMNSYIAEVVRDEEDALKQLDAELVPAAQGDLKAYLTQSRSEIAAQLEKAQALASARY
ncbi:protein of unknown function [Pseudoxanthomonas sp. GM95]|uniref:DUF4142 domain-containing protein n=1 Tax=Pseudoxanthomonas sp. GM95 TaxID=1881043 RepID=UPI0008D2855F|nr:DUF4142 domain-containing protein [Pseudoxanthomonas sp. GM95]SEL93958.1 protein of unknown function [Pseudoxanthomonas sp. GM95]